MISRQPECCNRDTEVMLTESFLFSFCVLLFSLLYCQADSLHYRTNGKPELYITGASCNGKCRRFPKEIVWYQQWSLVLTGLGKTGLKLGLWIAMGVAHKCNEGGIMRALEIKVVWEVERKKPIVV